MKILLDIPDNKASSLMVLLNDISYIKYKSEASYRCQGFVDRVNQGSH